MTVSKHTIRQETSPKSRLIQEQHEINNCKQFLPMYRTEFPS